MPISSTTPPSSVKAKKKMEICGDALNHRSYRNGLDYDDYYDNVHVVSNTKPVKKNDSISDHVDEVRKLLLGRDGSPPSADKNLAFLQLVRIDYVAIAVLETTSTMGMTAEQAKKRLVDVVNTK